MRARSALGLEFLGPLMFRRARPRPGAPATDPAAPPPPPPVPFVWTLPETLRLCEASGPNVGVSLDAWHWHHSGGTVVDIRAADPARIVHVHVSDARAMPPEDVPDDMRLLPGEGIIDLMGFFGRCRRLAGAARWPRRPSAHGSPTGRRRKKAPASGSRPRWL